MKRLFCMILTGLVFLLMPMTTIAGDNQWTGTGPFATGLGSRVITAITVDPTDPHIIYAGAGSGRVFQYNFPTYTLTVTKSGNGGGTVTAGANYTLSWVDNTGTCTVDDGTAITLTGTADTVSAAFAANNTTTAITSHTPDPSTFGQSVTFMATVTGGAGTPTGTVTFSEGATTHCPSVSLNGSGQAACNTSSLSVGSHTLTATYSGDGNYNGSSGTAGQTVLAVAPTVTSAAVTNITSSSASSDGSVTSDGGSPVTSRGVCYGTSSNPTTPCTTDGAGTGSFVSNLIGLAQNTVYHVRAYATNGVGMSYGDEVVFTTELLTHVVVPAATGNGNITLDTNSPGCGFTVLAAKTETQVGNDPFYNYPYGLVEFTLNCAAADVTITFPGDISDQPYRKYGPTTPGNPATTAWYTINNVTVNSSASITLHLTDGQLGDDTGVDGMIFDQGGPGRQGGNGVAAVPTMTEWGMIILIGLLGIGSVYYLRRRRSSI